MSVQAPSYEQTIKIPFDMGPTSYPGLNGVGGLEKHGVLNLDSLNVTGTINAGTVNVTNINAANITSGNLASARMTANFLTAAQASVSTLSSITANIGSITAGSITGTTITGALIRTSTGSSRVQLSDSTDAIQFLQGGIVRGSFTGGLSGGIKATNTVYTDTRGEGFGAFNSSGDYFLIYCDSAGRSILGLSNVNQFRILNSAGGTVMSYTASSGAWTFAGTVFNPAGYIQLDDKGSAYDPGVDGAFWFASAATAFRGSFGADRWQFTMFDISG